MILVITKGQKINDRYQIIKTIGEGGMANVYLAYDTILERNVAVKVLRGDLATDEKFVRRFQREALSASSLSHPNIVEVYDVGEDNGIYYIVMEYIEGKHLKQLLKKRGKLTLNEVIDIMLQITDGMACAHDRDIKPQNIMILENGIVKITDFGIAMALNSTQLTQTNSVMGSVHYLPPEQASGKGSTIQSDIYSMGILMYELLSGTLPYKGDNAVEIALKHLKEPLPSIRKEVPDIPQAVENVILKATAKNPKNRYSDARAMYDDLKTCTSESRADEKPYVYKYPEFDDVTVKKEKEIEKTREFAKVSDDTDEDKESKVEVKKITDKDLKKSENKTLKILSIILASLAVVTVIVVLLLPKLISTDEVQVPDVSGKTSTEAIEILNKAGLKVAPESKTAQSETIPEGQVVKTDPSAGRTVKAGATITLYESAGAKYYEMEDFTGQNYIEVKAVLEKVNNLFVVIEYEDVADSSKYTKNQIIRQEPEVGTKLKEGDTVKLFVPNLTEAYPDFTTGEYSLSDITAFCEKYNLTLKTEYVQTSEYEAGTIIKQNRPKGSEIISGYTLTITIAEEVDTSVDEEG